MFVQCKIVLKNVEKHFEEEFVKNFYRCHFSISHTNFLHSTTTTTKCINFSVSLSAMINFLQRSTKTGSRRHIDIPALKIAHQKLLRVVFSFWTCLTKCEEKRENSFNFNTVFFFFFSLRKVQLRQFEICTWKTKKKKKIGGKSDFLSLSRWMCCEIKR